MDIENILKEEQAKKDHLIQDNPDVIETHVDVHTFTEIEIYPEHLQRNTSKLFRDNKKLLQDKLGYGCWICNSHQDLEVHHWLEWALFEAIDTKAAGELLKILDVYGFSKHMNNKPLNTPDDIRNLVVLCKDHHRTPGTGIHTMTFPIWIAQKVDKQNMDVAISVSTYKKTLKKVQELYHKTKLRFKR